MPLSSSRAASRCRTAPQAHNMFNRSRWLLACRLGLCPGSMPQQETSEHSVTRQQSLGCRIARIVHFHISVSPFTCGFGGRSTLHLCVPVAISSCTAAAAAVCAGDPLHILWERRYDTGGGSSNVSGEPACNVDAAAAAAQASAAAAMLQHPACSACAGVTGASNDSESNYLCCGCGVRGSG